MGEELLHMPHLEITESLCNTSIRVHKSFLVSLNHIHKIDGNQLRIANRTKPIPLGCAYRENLFQVVENRIIGGKKYQKMRHPLLSSSLGDSSDSEA